MLSEKDLTMTVRDLLAKLRINISTIKVNGTIYTTKDAVEELDLEVMDFSLYYDVDRNITLEIN